MDLPIAGLKDEDACYAKPLAILQPDGLACPRRGSTRLGVHRRPHAPTLEHRCGDCRLPSGRPMTSRRFCSAVHVPPSGKYEP